VAVTVAVGVGVAVGEAVGVGVTVGVGVIVGVGVGVAGRLTVVVAPALLLPAAGSLLSEFAVAVLEST
jgi:hypothetical protein